MKLKLYRDKILSITNKGELVGVYVIYKWEHCGKDDFGNEILLAEMSPEKADKIIKLWNNKN